MPLAWASWLLYLVHGAPVHPHLVSPRGFNKRGYVWCMPCLAVRTTIQDKVKSKIVHPPGKVCQEVCALSYALVVGGMADRKFSKHKRRSVFNEPFPKPCNIVPLKLM